MIHDDDDIAQEAELIALQRGRAYANGQDRKWIAVKLWHRETARKRGGTDRQREDLAYVADRRDDPSSQAARNDDIAAIRQGVDRLPPHYREVIILHYFEGQTAVEIAGSLGVPLGTVKSRLFRAQRLLGSWLRWAQYR